MRGRWLLRGMALLWLVAGLMAIAAGSKVHAKAAVAQWLLARSWGEGTAVADAEPPWPGADLHVAAQLEVPDLGVTRYVLNQDSGEALAYGPGLGGAAMGAVPQPLMISGHRDTHFAFVGQLRTGMSIALTPRSGASQRYRVVRQVVIDSRRRRLPSGLTGEELLLVTCYPLDAVTAGGPLRLLTIAEPIAPGHAVASPSVDL